MKLHGLHTRPKREEQKKKKNVEVNCSDGIQKQNNKKKSWTLIGCFVFEASFKEVWCSLFTDLGSKQAGKLRLVL